MSQQEPHAARETPTTLRAQGDPWQAFGYIVGGVGFYGGVGYLLDRWWGTSFMVVVGILTGAVLGIYLTVTYLAHTGQRHQAQPDDPPDDPAADDAAPDDAPRREQD